MTQQKSVAVISGEALGQYHFGPQHPFGPDRLRAFVEGMERENLTDKVAWLQPRASNDLTLTSFHSREYVSMVRETSSMGEGYLDYGDTPARPGIFEAACHVVGSVVEITDRIMQRHYRRGFVPIAGLHHAYRERCSGFCVFNDIAVVIEHLRRQYDLERILYVDIDAHHGDGVYYSFENDAFLRVVDFHEDGRFLFPGTGDASETGQGAGKGHKMNIPMPPHADDELFAGLWPSAEKFMRDSEPQFILLQCGADSMKGDPITHLRYSEKTFRLAAGNLCRIADEYCEGRLLAMGGGGYNLDNIARAWPSVIREML